MSSKPEPPPTLSQLVWDSIGIIALAIIGTALIIGLMLV